MTTDQQKAQRVRNAMTTLAQQYNAEGQATIAQTFENACTDLPVTSLARLHDLLKNSEA